VNVDEDLLASNLATEIRAVAARSHSEEELRIGVERLLGPALQELGLDISPRYEKSYAAHGSVLRGSSDAVYGHLVIEYERVGALRRPSGVRHAADQLENYLQAEVGSSADVDSLRRAVGVGIDGERIFFVRYRPRASGGGAVSSLPYQQVLPLFLDATPPDESQQAKPFRILGPYPITKESVREFLLYLRALRRLALTPEALAEEFGPRGQVSRQLVGSFYAALTHTTHPKVKTLFDEWDRLFGIIYGQNLAKAQSDVQQLSAAYQLADADQLKPLLFAVHTYFALLMKLLAAELASLQSSSLLASPLAQLPSLSSGELRTALDDLENGGLFARLGIRNFLEGDFFGWYLSVWDAAVESSVREMVRSLSNFEPATTTLDPTFTRDLLKRLYQYLVPRKLRHDLGEFYTPDWLAELTLTESGYTGELSARLLDPGCGSGTFLVLAIRRKRDYADEHLLEGRQTLDAILDNIVGFDLNPLAVLAARTNYLLALGNLARFKSPLEIPVYLCDSVLTPARQSTGQSTYLDTLDFRLPSTVGEFVVPRSIVEHGELGAVTTLVQDCVRNGYNTEQFVQRARRELSASSSDVESTLGALFAKFQQLESEGRDGIWARILTNAFAPVFVGTFDYVIGNPPWVRWGYLSDAYRQATQQLWNDYGLFSLSGLAARLGGGEKDFSMLFLYACADNYLKPGGTLGFVITQEVLKGKGAGDGFRRFRLGEAGLPLRVLRAHDLVQVSPFEGAANKTAVLILQKGSPTQFPVPYVLWRRHRGVGAIASDASLRQAEELTDRQQLWAWPIGDRTNGAWQTVKPDEHAALDRLRGASAYRAYRGASVEPYGVFLLQVQHVRPDRLLVVENLTELGKRNIRKVQWVLEPTLLFPAVRGADIQRWHATPHVYALISQDPSTREGYSEEYLRTTCPKTLDYLNGFRNELLTRGSRTVRELAERTVPWSMFGIGPYTFAPYRVIWKRMAADFVVAVLSTVETPFGQRPMVGTDTTSYIPVDTKEEAHYLCGLLNSSPARAYIRSFSSAGRGFGAPSIIALLNLVSFDSSNQIHTHISALSDKAHQTMDGTPKSETDIVSIEADIDTSAAALWGINPAELKTLQVAIAR